MEYPMPRKNLILSKELPYHVTNRSNNKEWFYIPLEQTWKIFCCVLSNAAAKYNVDIHAFVLMSNHYHLILSTPLANLDSFMRYFQTEACRKVQRKALRINHVFGSRYRWSVLENSISFAYAYKYTLRNPVRAGLSSLVQDYLFCSSKFLIGSNFDLPLVERIDNLGRQIPKSTKERLLWLNSPTPKEVEVLIGKALRRFQFAFSKGNDVRQQLKLLKVSYGVEISPSTFSAEK